MFFHPKWTVKIMENPIKMNDLRGFPPIFGLTPILLYFLEGIWKLGYLSAIIHMMERPCRVKEWILRNLEPGSSDGE